MKRIRTTVLATLAGLTMAMAIAQPGPGKGPGAGPGMGPGPMAAGPGASAPGMGMGMGHGGGRGAGRWGADYTPGWAMMTQQERNEHRERMRSMTSYEACKTYHEQHHEQMAARAKERGAQMMAQPRRDACAGLKK